MIDCGAGWRGELDAVRPYAIVLTHAHPGHAWGLEDGAPCPVYVTEVTWAGVARYPIEDKRTIEPGRSAAVETMTFDAFTVEHSTRCPAVCFRVRAGNACILYAPDLVYIHERKEAFSDVKRYIGDGATSAQSFVRKRGEYLIGHSPTRTQLTWCQKEGVDWAIFTHCGAQIVEGSEAAAEAQLREWGNARGVDVALAYDGLEIVLR